MPKVVAVNVEEQVAEALVEAAKVQVVNDPATPVSDRVTLPVGVTKVPGDLSMTRTVQVEFWLTATGDVQLTLVDALLLSTVTLVAFVLPL